MTMRKDLRQMLKALRAEGIVVAVEHGGKHDCLTLCNGRQIALARTPSDYRGMRNAIHQIKRLAKT